MKVGQFAKELLQMNQFTNQEILEKVKEKFPDGKTTIGCIAWYKSDLKKTKVDEDKPFKDWLKSNEMRLREEFQKTLEVTE